MYERFGVEEYRRLEIYRLGFTDIAKYYVHDVYVAESCSSGDVFLLSSFTLT